MKFEIDVTDIEMSDIVEKVGERMCEHTDFGAMWLKLCDHIIDKKESIYDEVLNSSEDNTDYYSGYYQALENVASVADNIWSEQIQKNKEIVIKELLQEALFKSLMKDEEDGEEESTEELETDENN